MIGKPLYAADSLAAVADGAIIGEDTGTGQEALQFGAADFMSTNTLVDNETGDMQGLSEMACECWYRADSAFPSGTRDILRGPTSNGGSVEWRMRITASGTITATIITTTGTYTATTAAVLTLGQYHHLVTSFTGSLLSIYIDGVSAASVAAAGTFLGLDSGTGSPEMLVSDSASTTSSTFDEIAVYRHSLTDSRVLAHYQAGALRGFDRELTGARINAVLDAAESVAPRSLDVGARTMMGVRMAGQDPKGETERTVAAEAVDALMFVDRTGQVTFLDSAHRSSSPYDTVQATFDDDGTDLPYEEATVDFSESFLVNEWNITRLGDDAVTQTASDATSISRYLKRPQSMTGIPVTSDADCLDIATDMLAKYKEPMTRITSLTLTSDVPAVSEAIFAREIGDRIRVFRTPPGGGSRIDQTLFIQKIDVEKGEGDPVYRVRWGVSPV